MDSFSSKINLDYFRFEIFMHVFYIMHRLRAIRYKTKKLILYCFRFVFYLDFIKIQGII